jgi:hypothetical protein
MVQLCAMQQESKQNEGRVFRSFATTVLHLKMCAFSGETFKGFEVL